jgi:hypothetical protein
LAAAQGRAGNGWSGAANYRLDPGSAMYVSFDAIIKNLFH